jgi:hypothetical protein
MHDGISSCWSKKGIPMKDINGRCREYNRKKKEYTIKNTERTDWTREKKKEKKGGFCLRTGEETKGLVFGDFSLRVDLKISWKLGRGVAGRRRGKQGGRRSTVLGYP